MVTLVLSRPECAVPASEPAFLLHHHDYDDGWSCCDAPSVASSAASWDATIILLVSLAGTTFDFQVATWLILPVVICLSQRLSHACLSTSRFKAKPRMAH